MSNFKARGIVLKEILIGEKDKNLTILTKNYGKLNIWAKNSRIIKNKLFSGTTLFSYADFMIYDTGKNLLLNQVDLIESFFNLTSNLDKLAYGTYFLELTDKTILENIECNDILLLLLKTLTILCKTTMLKPKLISKVFEIKFLQLNGYMPNLNFCTKCLINIQDFNNNIFLGNEGLICHNCKGKEDDIIKINQSIIYTLNYILNSKIDKLYNFNISDSLLNDISLISKKLTNQHFYYNLKTKIFINEIENL